MPARLVHWMLLPILAAAIGCRAPGMLGDSIPPPKAGLSFIHPVQKPDDGVLYRCCRLLPEEKGRVHIFVCNGVDPFCLGNLNGFCHVVRSLGFENIWFGQVWEPGLIERRIVQVRQADPCARIVLLGYSAGANEVRNICNRLQTCDIVVDLLVYLGGDTLRDTPESRPANASRVLNITGHGFVVTGGDLFYRGSEIQGATNVRLDERHILLPSRSAALELFLIHLAEVARTSPIK